MNGPITVGDSRPVDPLREFFGYGIDAFPPRPVRPDAPTSLGFGFTLLLLACLCGPIWVFNLPWCGPNSWRMLEFVRIALFTAAISGLERLLALHACKHLERAFCMLGPVVLLGLSAAAWPIGGELRGQMIPPGDSERQGIERVWEWLREHRGEIPGRVFVQDTFGAPTVSGKLANSHIMALTGQETGLEVLGAYYGIVPFPTGILTRSEFGGFFGHMVNQEYQVPPFAERLGHYGCSHLATVDPALGTLLSRSTLFRKKGEIPGWVIWEILDHESNLVQPLLGQATISGVERTPGKIKFELMSQDLDGAVAVKESYHTFWEAWWVEGERRQFIPIVRNGQGLMALAGLPSGRNRIEMVFRAPEWPFWMTLAAWIGWLASINSLRRMRPGVFPESTPEGSRGETR